MTWLILNLPNIRSETADDSFCNFWSFKQIKGKSTTLFPRLQEEASKIGKWYLLGVTHLD